MLSINFFKIIKATSIKKNKKIERDAKKLFFGRKTRKKKKSKRKLKGGRKRKK